MTDSGSLSPSVSDVPLNAKKNKTLATSHTLLEFLVMMFPPEKTKSILTFNEAPAYRNQRQPISSFGVRGLVTALVRGGWTQYLSSGPKRRQVSALQRKTDRL